MRIFLMSVFCLTAIIIVLTASARINNQRAHGAQLRNILNNPTFSGVVVSKEATAGAHLWSSVVSAYRVHIIGQYIENGQVVKVDNTFNISRYMLYSFHLGFVDITFED